MRKPMILMAAIAALGVIAVSASGASAATEWTDNGVVVRSGVDLTQTFEGPLQLRSPAPAPSDAKRQSKRQSKAR
jgi:hypothetical protein